MSRHRLTVLSLSLAAVLLTLASAQDNQCFYAADKRAGSIIVPCSSTTGSYASCCQLGDLCLSDSACWNPEFNVTYLYGCTDSTYTDYHCPYKCGPSFANAPYVGLDYCSNTTNLEWSCTHPPNSDAAIQAFNYAAPCLDDSIIAFAGPVSLPPYLSLPTNIGGSTLYFSPTGGSYIPVTGYTPTTTAQAVASSVPHSVEYVGSTATTTTTSSSPSSTSPTSASPPSTSTSTSTAPTSTTSSTPLTSASSSSSSSAPSTTSSTPSSPIANNNKPATSSNTGLKVGLGVGIAGGVLFLAALILFFLMWRRRRQRHAAIPQHETDDGSVYGGAHHEKTHPTRYQDSPAAAGFGHSRGPSELSATNVDTYRNPATKAAGSFPNTATSPHTSPVPLYSEFEGSPVPAPHPAAPPQRYELGESR